MVRRRQGGYHGWRSFVSCPECRSEAVDLEFYQDGTMFRCTQCGAEAWSEQIGETES